MNVEQHHVSTPDGRTLEVSTVGRSKGDTIFFHHGTPGSVALISFFAEMAERADIFVVAMSRPGYGNSSRLEGRTVASVVNDVTAVLDSLGRDSYLSVGWSGGGPHALACAALDTPRCRAAWSLAGVAPMDADFDWTEGMGPENLEEFALATEGGVRYEEFMARAAEEFSGATPDNIVELFGTLLPPVDKAALAEVDARLILANSARHAFTNGWYGFYDDDRAFFAPWGFDPTAIEVPVAVWYGDQDLMVPPSHGAWLASNLATALPTHFAHEGHLSLVTNHLDDLVAAFKSVASRP